MIELLRGFSDNTIAVACKGHVVRGDYEKTQKGAIEIERFETGVTVGRPEAGAPGSTRSAGLRPAKSTRWPPAARSITPAARPRAPQLDTLDGRDSGHFGAAIALLLLTLWAVLVRHDRWRKARLIENGGA